MIINYSIFYKGIKNLLIYYNIQMKDCLLIFPNNLFNKKLLPKINNVIIIEDTLFFKDKERIKKN